jgi:hypothetical protein
LISCELVAAMSSFTVVILESVLMGVLLNCLQVAQIDDLAGARW